jgi:hypothetical protein
VTRRRLELRLVLASCSCGRRRHDRREHLLDGRYTYVGVGIAHAVDFGGDVMG